MRISDWSSDVCSSDLRAAILLAAEGLSIEEAAASLAIPAGNFKSRLWRGRLRLKRLMEHRDTPLLDRRVAEKCPMTRPRRHRNWKGVVIGQPRACAMPPHHTGRYEQRSGQQPLQLDSPGSRAPARRSQNHPRNARVAAGFG